MKRILSLALGCLLFCTLTTSALANQWGLRGGVLDIVQNEQRFADYTGIADDGNTRLTDSSRVNQAILKNRYHTVLISAARADKRWQAEVISTAAVYQPGDRRGEYPHNPSLTHLENDGFVLSYGGEEQYTFLWNGHSYILGEARYHLSSSYNESFIMEGEGLVFWQPNPGDAFLPVGDALWPVTISLAEFNITQMPRTLAEMRRVNMTSTYHQDTIAPLSPTARWHGAADAGMLPVYTAPDEASFRAANGKASVSLGGDITIYGTADGWTLIGYEVSPRTSRIGYVHRELGGEPLTLGNLPLRAAVNTFLTDDPFVSQYAQADIPEGTVLTGLALCGHYYAYVDWEADGRQYRGFVPLKDLMPVYDTALSTSDTHLTADVRWDVMDALCGKWLPESGSREDMLVLYTNGGFCYRQDGITRDMGNYRVYDGENGGYVLYQITEDNRESRFTLVLNVDGTITLQDGSAETVYVRREYSTYGNG